VNCHGRVQRFQRAFPPFRDAREDWRILLEVARLRGGPLTFRSPEQIFSAMEEAVAR
jgi:predicted molibdopterin-dependent oxidoreductase YjgC